jgi:hypothetical protein
VGERVEACLPFCEPGEIAGLLQLGDGDGEADLVGGPLSVTGCSALEMNARSKIQFQIKER